MSRKHVQMTWVLFLVVAMALGAGGLSGCVAPDGGVYAMQPVAALPAETTALEANKAFIGEYFAALNQDKSPATVERFVVDEVLIHHIDLFETAFPGYQLRAEEMLAEGNKVFVRTTFTGVHNGDLMGIAPTGNAVEIAIALVYEIEDGKIVDHWMLHDGLGLMQQIGVIPAQ